MISKSPFYDLAVAYRICPRISKAARGLPFSDDKYQLSEVCLRSFVESLGSLRVKLWALLDGCPPEYEALFRKYLAPKNLVILRLEGIGNRPSFDRQIDILLTQENADLVYFAEDDYFYLPNQFPEMLRFLTDENDVDFVSPYDHLDCYTLAMHQTPEWIKICESHHWRTAASTCLTFLTRKQTLAKYETVFRSYLKGNDDCSLWLSLTKHQVFDPLAFGHYVVRRLYGWNMLGKAWLHGWRQILFGRKLKLWVPIPGIATHLNRNSLSPNVDWLDRMRQRVEV
jgi:hypothetical protein